MADLIYGAVLERFTDEEFDDSFEFEGMLPESDRIGDITSVTATKVDGTDATDDVIIGYSSTGTALVVTLNTGSTETAYVIVAIITSLLTAAPFTMTKLLNVTATGLYR